MAMASEMAEKRQEKPHAIVLPFPVDGHINPLMHLSKILATMGFDITFVNTEGNHQRLLNTAEKSSSSSQSNPDFDFRLVGLAGLPLEETINVCGKDSGTTLIDCAHSMRDQFEDLVRKEVCVEKAVTCIIYDYLVDWVPPIANKYGIQKVAFVTNSVAGDLQLKGLAELWLQGLIPIPENLRNSGVPVISTIPDVPIMLEDVPFLAQQSPDMKELEWVLQAYLKIRETDWVLVNSFEELESKAVEQIRKESRTKHYLPVGPLHPFAFDMQVQANGTGLTLEDRSCLLWLDTQDPASVLYVSFGSISTISKAQLRTIAMGVASSNKPFLWVQRPTLTGDEDSGSCIYELLKDGHGTIVPWAPQMEVLLHPSVGGFLTHCGWNSTLESISAGVPMLGWPCMSDQHLNHKMLVHVWKIALDFKDASRDESGFVCSEDVRKGVFRLLEGEDGKSCRSRIAKMKELALTAAGFGGSSRNNLRFFVDAMHILMIE